MTVDASIFKDYDIRGTYPDQFNKQVASQIAQGIVRQFHPKTIAIVRDMRLSGEEIRNGLVDVFTNVGIDVYDAGLGGTEMAYFIAGTKPYELVIMISASHNPPAYNGLKIVLRGPVAITSDTGLFAVREHLKEGPLPRSDASGSVTALDIWDEWRDKVLSLVDTSLLKPLSVVVDAGNGMGGMLVSKVFNGLPFHLTKLYFEPDGRFPHHTPNPLIESNNVELVNSVRQIHADIGLTFDGDADRMFLIDDTGRLVSGTITTAMLSRYILKKHPGETILYNAICGRIVPQMIEQDGGKSKRVRVGHSYIKTYMKETGAIFAGEHSGHYYHRDFFAAESGVLTALMVLSLLSTEERSLSQIVNELDIYPASGEINFIVDNISSVIDAMKNTFTDASSKDELDGISVWYPTYWFNIRASKTEPLLRLNIEADTQEILEEKKVQLIASIESLGGKKK